MSPVVSVTLGSEGFPPSPWLQHFIKLSTLPTTQCTQNIELMIEVKDTNISDVVKATRRHYQQIGLSKRLK